MVAGCSGSPFSRVNTLPESTHAGPQASRSVSWARRCARSAVTVPVSSATVRSPASDLGSSSMTFHPAAPAAAARPAQRRPGQRPPTPRLLPHPGVAPGRRSGGTGRRADPLLRRPGTRRGGRDATPSPGTAGASGPGPRPVTCRSRCVRPRLHATASHARWSTPGPSGAFLPAASPVPPH